MNIRWQQILKHGIAGAMPLVLAWLVLPATVLAQTEQSGKIGNAESVQKDQSVFTKQQILAYLANERILIPGVGFEDARLGTPLSEVRERWGSPVSERLTGLLQNKREILYQADENTMIVFGGKGVLSEITVKGLPGSFTRTRKGIQFGMDRNKIKRVYFAPPDKDEKGRLEYPDLGINFFFQEQDLSKIVVYPKDS